MTTCVCEDENYANDETLAARQKEADRLLRPLARRRAKTLRPPTLALRARNP